MPFDAEPSVEVAARDRLIRLRDFLAELSDVKFDFCDYGDSDPECQTPACIAGWGSRIFRADLHWSGGCDVLGLDEDRAHLLFNPGTALPCASYSEVRTHHAVAVLDHLIATGEVDWSVAFK